MTPTLKTPTPQGISALLRKAGHARAVVKLHGGRAGFDVHTDISTGAVKVEHFTNTMGGSGYSEVKLTAYAKTITDAGYDVIKPSPRWILVNAKEED
jgi:hypothetical protein